MHEIEMLGLLDHDVLSSIELPFLPDITDPAATPNPTAHPGRISQAEADRFDNDVFSAKHEPRPQPTARNSLTSVGSQRYDLKRTVSTRTSDGGRQIASIPESPHNLMADLPFDPPGPDMDPASNRLSVVSHMQLSTSPSQSSVRSARSARSARSTGSTGSAATSSTAAESTRPSVSRSSTKASRFTPSWLWSTFTRSGPSQPQTSAVSAAGVTSPLAPSPLATRPPIMMAEPTTSFAVPTQIPVQRRRSPKPVAIGSPTKSRLGTVRNLEDDSATPQRGSLVRQSPVNTPPRDDATFGKRRSMTITSMMSVLPSSASPIIRTNPLKPLDTSTSSQSSLARRWQHLFPKPLSKHEIKWRSMVTPACLPLSVEFLPPMSELESSFDMSLYDFVIDPPEMRSFLVRPPVINSNNVEIIRRAWALSVMRGMVAVRLAQGFQFVLRSAGNITPDMENIGTLRRATSYIADGDTATKPAGVAEVLQSASEPLYLSMSNEIHRIVYSGDSVQVRRYVRRMPRTKPLEYKCLIWPKLGVGYTELKTSFVSYGLENYGWNRYVS